MGSSGAEAIRLYEAEKPDVMLMDIRMDGMTGLEAGEHMGRFLYLLDAMEDLDRDKRRGNYNPLAAVMAEGATREDILDILVNQMASCAALIDRLPLVQDAELLKNILYTGVWSSLRRKGDTSE